MKPATVETTAPKVPPVRAWWTVAVLTFCFIVSFVDRTIISLLTEPIKADLGFSDTQLALLQGAAFGLFYTALGLPLGWLMDHASRRKVIMAGVTIWCLATAACGLVQNFIQMFMARLMVGAGEATLNPGAVSIIGDSFAPEKRGLPFGVYAGAAACGSGLALVLGGGVIALVAQTSEIVLPLIGAVKGWQTVFIVVGLLGLVCVPLLMTITEPSRATPAAVINHATEKKPTLIGLIRNWPGFFILFIVGVGFFASLAHAVLSWVPASFVRTHGWSPQDVGLRYGLVLLTCGPLGGIFSGWLAGRLKKRGFAAVDLWLSGLAMPLAGALIALAVTAPSGTIALLWFAPAFFFFNFPSGLPLSAIQNAVPSALRGRAAALYYLVVGLIGLAFGPLAVALLTDYVFRDPAALPLSLATAAIGFGCISGALTLLSLRGWRRMTTSRAGADPS